MLRSLPFFFSLYYSFRSCPVGLFLVSGPYIYPSSAPRTTHVLPFFPSISSTIIVTISSHTSVVCILAIKQPHMFCYPGVSLRCDSGMVETGRSIKGCVLRPIQSAGATTYDPISIMMMSIKGIRKPSLGLSSPIRTVARCPTCPQS